MDHLLSREYFFFPYGIEEMVASDIVSEWLFFFGNNNKKELMPIRLKIIMIELT